MNFLNLGDLIFGLVFTLTYLISIMIFSKLSFEEIMYQKFQHLNFVKLKKIEIFLLFYSKNHMKKMES